MSARESDGIGAFIVLPPIILPNNLSGNEVGRTMWGRTMKTNGHGMNLTRFAQDAKTQRFQVFDTTLLLNVFLRFSFLCVFPSLREPLLFPRFSVRPRAGFNQTTSKLPG